MAKRTRLDSSDPHVPHNLPNSFSEGSQQSTFSEGPGLPSPSGPEVGVSNFCPSVPSPTPLFPVFQAQTSLFHVNPPFHQAPTRPPPVQPTTFGNALDFLDQVKQQFEDNPWVYEEFLRIMKDFKLQTIDTSGVILRVSELFRGHDHLLMGFNCFLPEGYKITQSDSQPNQLCYQVPGQEGHFPLPSQEGEVHIPKCHTPSSTPSMTATPPTSTLEIDAPGMVLGNSSLEHARNYVQKIQVRLEAQPEVYQQFLQILHTFHKEHQTIHHVYEQVAVLFQNHTDLLDEFKQFFPDFQTSTMDDGS